MEAATHFSQQNFTKFYSWISNESKHNKPRKMYQLSGPDDSDNTDKVTLVRHWTM